MQTRNFNVCKYFYCIISYWYSTSVFWHESHNAEDIVFCCSHKWPECWTLFRTILVSGVSQIYLPINYCESHTLISCKFKKSLPSLIASRILIWAARWLSERGGTVSSREKLFKEQRNFYFSTEYTCRGSRFKSGGSRYNYFPGLRL